MRIADEMALKNFIPDGVCLACDGCCRFSKQKTIWAPFFAFEEIVGLTEKDIVPSCLFTHPDTAKESGAQIDLISGAHAYLCPCLECASNNCKIYPDRPLDCRLYPFLLARRGPEIFCAVDERCPYAQQVKGTDKIRQYVQYLVDFFNTEEFFTFIKNNPGFVQDYGDDAIYLRSLPALSSMLYGTSASFLRS